MKTITVELGGSVSKRAVIIDGKILLKKKKKTCLFHGSGGDHDVGSKDVTRIFTLSKNTV